MCCYFLPICRILRKLHVTIICYFSSNLFYILQLRKDWGLRPDEIDLWRRFTNKWDTLRLHDREMNVLDFQIIEVIIKMNGNCRNLDQKAESKNHIYRELDEWVILPPTNGIQQSRYR